MLKTVPMKRQKELKRLSLKAETLRRLETLADYDLGHVAGGAARKSVYCNPTSIACHLA